MEKFEDWSDAKWVYLSVDHPLQAYLDATDAEGKMPTSPSDGSAWFAMKMDDEHVYFGLRVRDDVPILAGEAAGAALYAYDHLSVFLGLCDLGLDAYSSPHLDLLNMTTGAHLIHPVLLSLFIQEVLIVLIRIMITQTKHSVRLSLRHTCGRA